MENELKKRFQMLAEEILKDRNISWEKAKEQMIGSLLNAGYEVGDDKFTNMMNIIEASWGNGYSHGSKDTTIAIMRSIGYGNVVDKVLKYAEALVPNPVNN